MFSLAVFVYLLTLHPTAAGRVYAAYGGVHVAVAMLWLWWIDAVRPTRWDWLGAGDGRRGHDYHHARAERRLN